jgi:hypothetical protein
VFLRADTLAKDLVPKLLQDVRPPLPPRSTLEAVHAAFAAVVRAWTDHTVELIGDGDVPLPDPAPGGWKPDLDVPVSSTVGGTQPGGFPRPLQLSLPTAEAMVRSLLCRMDELCLAIGTSIFPCLDAGTSLFRRSMTSEEHIELCRTRDQFGQEALPCLIGRDTYSLNLLSDRILEWMDQLPPGLPTEARLPELSPAQLAELEVEYTTYRAILDNMVRGVQFDDSSWFAKPEVLRYHSGGLLFVGTVPDLIPSVRRTRHFFSGNLQLSLSTYNPVLLRMSEAQEVVEAERSRRPPPSLASFGGPSNFAPFGGPHRGCPTVGVLRRCSPKKDNPAPPLVPKYFWMEPLGRTSVGCNAARYVASLSMPPAVPRASSSAAVQSLPSNPTPPPRIPDVKGLEFNIAPKVKNAETPTGPVRTVARWRRLLIFQRCLASLLGRGW